MIVIHTSNSHVSQDTVDDFEKELLSHDGVYLAPPTNKQLYKWNYFFYKLCRKIHVDLIPYAREIYKKDPSKDSGHLFTVMMGLDEMKWRPFGLSCHHVKSVYLFDAWPKDYNKIVDFCCKYKIDYLFVTSKQSTNRLSELMPDVCVRYVPEAVRVERYSQSDYSSRTIDVLAMGRKWDDYHNRIVDGLKSLGKNYLYEKEKGRVIFSDRNSLINGLSSSKISICVPSSITHPERAGDVETMTVRYLESMASKCLVLGMAPAEMVELFGYNPVIQIDLDNPVNQIADILNHYFDYIPLIEKNYQVVKQYHTWTNRYEQMNMVWKEKII